MSVGLLPQSVVDGLFENSLFQVIVAFGAD